MKGVTMSRRTLSMLFAALALCLGLGLLAAGCGASGPPPPVEPGISEEPLAESTVSILTKCAKSWAGDLKERSYKLRFNVTVNKRGGVSDVAPEGSGLDGSDLEKCMIGALTNMTVPPFVYERAEEQRASRGIPAHARGLVGQTAAEPILIILTPVVIEAAPVVIVVIIGIVVVAAVATSMSSEMSEECEEEWTQARKRCRALLKGRNPPRGVTGGYLDVEDCAKGLVSWDCGGNPIDEGNQGRPGRKY
jgi:multisubunit Na+/H+ antiporter MnhC subunit